MTIDNCSIISDLLPSYIDGICSEDSRELIEKHLKKCEHCRNTYNEMTGAKIEPMVVDIKNITEPFTKINTRYHIKVLVCVIAVLILIGTGATVFKAGLINPQLKMDTDFTDEIYFSSVDELEQIAMKSFRYLGVGTVFDISELRYDITSIKIHHETKRVIWRGFEKMNVDVFVTVTYADGTTEEMLGFFYSKPYIFDRIEWENDFALMKFNSEG